MQIDIVSDTICPWCFIGKRRLERALAQRPDLNVQIGWRPFQLNPDMPREGMDRKAYLTAKFGNDNGGAMYDAVKQAGMMEGIAFAFDKMVRTPNTLRSHQLIRWASSANLQHEVVNILFRRYFLEGADIGDTNVLVEVAGEAGMDVDLVSELYTKDSDIDLVRAEDEMAREMGIQGVPCFIIDRKFAVSGAQDPQVFLQMFDYVEKHAAEDITV